MLTDLHETIHDLRLAYHTQEAGEIPILIYETDIIPEIVTIMSNLELDSSIDMFLTRQLENISMLMSRIEEESIREKL